MTSQIYNNMLRVNVAISWSKQSLWRHRSIKICYVASMQSADPNKAYDVTGLSEYVTRHPCNQLIQTKPMTSHIYQNMLRGICAISWFKQSLWRHRSIGICYAASLQSADPNKAYDVTGLSEYVTRHTCNQIQTKPMTAQVYRNMLRGIHVKICWSTFPPSPGSISACLSQLGHTMPRSGSCSHQFTNAIYAHNSNRMTT